MERERERERERRVSDVTYVGVARREGERKIERKGAGEMGREVEREREGERYICI